MSPVKKIDRPSTGLAISVRGPCGHSIKLRGPARCAHAGTSSTGAHPRGVARGARGPAI